jgi:hypothetical protein
MQGHGVTAVVTVPVVIAVTAVVVATPAGENPPLWETVTLGGPDVPPAAKPYDARS